jgi:hypothetical protein
MKSAPCSSKAPHPRRIAALPLLAGLGNVFAQPNIEVTFTATVDVTAVLIHREEGDHSTSYEDTRAILEFIIQKGSPAPRLEITPRKQI